MDIDHESNGEAWIVGHVAPTVRTFVDVGANLGEWTDVFLSAAEPAVRGLLFEPSVAASSALETKFAGTPQATIIRAAASDSAGTAVFYEEPGAGRHSSLVAGFSSKLAEPTTVRTVPLDDELDERGWSELGYLKIDAEGHDLQVLRGVERRLSERRVGFVQFEYNDAWRLAGNRLGEAFELLEKHGYAVYLLKGPGLWVFPRSVYGEFYRYSNFVALPAERREAFGELVRGVA